MKLRSKKEEKKTEEEKVEERREEVLAAGRKFKYPLQWTKHRVVINTILIAVVVFTVIIMGGWLALYRFNMTDDMLYRITKILPVSVASVDGEQTRFSDYLMLYRSSMLSIKRQSGQIEGEDPSESLESEYMRAALSEAEEYTYAMKLAKELDIKVTDEEIEAEFKRHQSAGGIERSEASFMKIIEENFGLDKGEYYRLLYLTLTKAKVESAIDEKAANLAAKVENLLGSMSYSEAANNFGDEVIYEETGGMVSSQNIDGGRASMAINMEPGTESGKFISTNGDGYYFVKLISKTETEVNFVSIKIPFTEFESRFTNLKLENKIDEFISISE